MSLGIQAARLVGNFGIKARQPLKKLMTEAEHFDHFIKKPLSKASESVHMAPAVTSVPKQFTDMVEQGYHPEHLVVTPNEVILDLETIQRDAFRKALQEAAQKDPL